MPERSELVLRTLYSAEIDSTEDEYHIRIPEIEINRGAIDPNRVYRVALLEPAETSQRQENGQSASNRANEIGAYGGGSTLGRRRGND